MVFTLPVDVFKKTTVEEPIGLAWYLPLFDWTVGSGSTVGSSLVPTEQAIIKSQLWQKRF